MWGFTVQFSTFVCHYINKFENLYYMDKFLELKIHTKDEYSKGQEERKKVRL